MRTRSALLLLILAGLGVFAGLNWATMTASTPLYLVFVTLDAPLGLVLLGAIGLVTLLYVVSLVWLETSTLLESRRHARELRAQRELAERAEASRYAELKQLLEGMQAALHRDIERSGNTLAAYIGEMDDRWADALQARTTSRPSAGSRHEASESAMG